MIPSKMSVSLRKGSYNILNKIGHGAFASVYKVSHASSGKNFALKVMVAHDTTRKELFDRELALLTQLGQHPNITSLSDHIVNKRAHPIEYNLLFPLCSPLPDICEISPHTFSNSQLQTITLHIAKALHHLHTLSPPIYHRDVKLENTLKHDTSYQLCDFGSASTTPLFPSDRKQRLVIESEISKFTTPAYRSPEMVDIYRGDPIDDKSDVWALGVLVYILAFGCFPFGDGSNKLAITNKSLSIPKTSVDRSKLILDVIRGCLEKDYRKRLRAADVIGLIEGVAPVQVESSIKSDGVFDFGSSFDFKKVHEETKHSQDCFFTQEQPKGATTKVNSDDLFSFTDDKTVEKFESFGGFDDCFDFDGTQTEIKEVASTFDDFDSQFKTAFSSTAVTPSPTVNLFDFSFTDSDPVKESFDFPSQQDSIKKSSEVKPAAIKPKPKSNVPLFFSQDFFMESTSTAKDCHAVISPPSDDEPDLIEVKPKRKVSISQEGKLSSADGHVEVEDYRKSITRSFYDLSTSVLSSLNKESSTKASINKIIDKSVTQPKCKYIRRIVIDLYESDFNPSQLIISRLGSFSNDCKIPAIKALYLTIYLIQEGPNTISSHVKEFFDEFKISCLAKPSTLSYSLTDTVERMINFRLQSGCFFETNLSLDKVVASMTGRYKSLIRGIATEKNVGERFILKFLKKLVLVFVGRFSTIF
ncbi:hypothetical protein GEMRC1_012233 [Eukaryota sp. GEM-RC1]